MKITRPTPSRARAAGFAILVVLANRASANDAHDFLMRASEEERREALAAAARSVGSPCSAGTETFFQGFGLSGEAYWSVRCREGVAYNIALYPDARSSFSVIECGVLALKTQVDCFRSFDDQQ